MEQHHQPLQNNEIVVANKSTTDLLNFNKKKITSSVQTVIKSVQDGEYDPLKALVFAKKLELMAKTLNDGVRPIAEEKHKIAKNETYKIFDTEITTSDTGVKWDYTVCGDPIWDDLSADLEKIKELLKTREEFLKAISKRTSFVDEETGEVVELMPPNRLAHAGLKVTLK